MKSLRIKVIIFVVFVFLLASCIGAKSADSSRNDVNGRGSVVLPTETSPSSMANAGQIQESESTIPETSNPASTLEPTATILQATAIATSIPGPIITSNNLSQLKKIDHLGVGTFAEIDVDGSGELIAVRSSTGIYLLNGDDLSELSSIENLSNELALSVDGNRLALGQNEQGTSSGFVNIYLINENGLGEEEWTIPTDFLKDIAFTPQGDKLISLDTNLIKIIDLSNGEVISSFSNDDGGQMAVHPSGDFVAIASDVNAGPTTLLDLTDGTTIRTFSSREGGSISDIAFSSDGELLAIAANDLTVWRVSDGTQVWISKGPTGAVDFNPNGTELIAIKPLKETYEIYQSSDGTLIKSYPSGQVMTDVRYMPSSDQVITVDSFGLTLRQVPDWQELARVDEYLAWAHTMALTLDNNHIALGGWDGIVEMWDLEGRKRDQIFHGHTNLIKGIALSEKENLLATASLDNTTRVWSVADGNLLMTIDTPFIEWAEIEEQSSQGKMVTLGILAYFSAPIDIEFSPDGQMLVVSSNDGVQVWDIGTKELVHSFSSAPIIGSMGSNGWSSFSLSPDGNEIAISSAGQSVKVYNIKTGENLWDAPVNFNVTDIMHSTDGTSLIILGESNNDTALQIWDVESRSQQNWFRIASDTPNTRWGRPMQYLSNSNAMIFYDGDIFASNHALGSFDMNSGAQIDKVWRIGALYDYKITSDGTRIIMGVSDTGTIDIWEVEP